MNVPLHQRIDDAGSRPCRKCHTFVSPYAASELHPCSGIELLHRHPWSTSLRIQIFADQLLDGLVDNLRVLLKRSAQSSDFLPPAETEVSELPVATWSKA